MVVCSDQKREAPAQAADLYLSERFTLSRELVEQLKVPWQILSARHGLVKPEAVLSPYECHKDDLGPLESDTLRKSIGESLQNWAKPSDRTVVLGDQAYFESLAGEFIDKGGRWQPLAGKTRPQQREWLLTAMGRRPRKAHLERFYDILARLRGGLGKKRFGECTPADGWPEKGVYFFFEASEPRTLDSALRVVRVGTHGVSEGAVSTLWQRLSNHQGTRSGTGSHRGSIFRLHVGTALRGKNSDFSEINTWGIGENVTPAIRESEQKLEKAVTDFIGRMEVLWIDVGDAASSTSDRAYLEQNAIALLAGASGPFDVGSDGWLGKSCAHPEVRWSSLWNVNHVHQSYDARFLDILDRYVDITLGIEPRRNESLAPKNWQAFTSLGMNQSTLGGYK